MNVSSVDAQDLLVRDYLTAVAHAAADLPAVHRDELLADLSEHIAVARSQCAPTEAGVRTILDRLGHPLAIVDAARGFAGSAYGYAAGPAYGYAAGPAYGYAAGPAYGWAAASGAPRATAGPASAPAAEPYWSLAAIWNRSPIAVALIVVAALGVLVLVVGVFGVAAVAPPVR
jgi:hypothetical protein